MRPTRASKRPRIRILVEVASEKKTQRCEGEERKTQKVREGGKHRSG